MNGPIVELLLNAARSILGEAGLTVSSIRPASPAHRSAAVAAVVGIVGELSGTILLAFRGESAEAVVRAMYSSMGLPSGDQVEEDLRDAAIGEFANEVVGRTVTLLSEQSLACDLTPPAVFSGEKVAASLPGVARMETRVMEGSFGELVLSIGLDERAPDTGREQNS